MVHRLRVVAILAALAIAAFASGVMPQNSTDKFEFTLSGSQEVPSNNSTGSATAEVKIVGDQLKVEFSFEGLTGPITGAHIHGPAPAGQNAGVIFNIVPGQFPAGTGSPIEATFPITEEQKQLIRSGQTYLNLHTTQFPGGEIRGQVLPEPDVD